MIALSSVEPTRILYMEDDPGLARLVQKRLERAGYIVDLAANGQEGLEMYGAGQYDVVAVDHSMPVRDGLQVINALASAGPLPPAIMITGTGNERTAVSAMKLGARDYVVKDVDGGFLELLPSVIERALRQQRLEKEKQQADQELRRYAAELRTRNEELDAFAHSVAHDLKAPLSNLAGFAEMLARDYGVMPDETRREFHERISASATRMSNIVDALLLLASVRRKEDVEVFPLDVSDIVQGALRRQSYLVRQHRAHVDHPQHWPVAIGNSDWVEEVWVNYVSNAIKYGGSPPHVQLGADPAADGQVRFWVRDNGHGIGPDDQKRLFTPFARLDQATAKGHGLGLSIVRRIVERLGGEVGVESALTKGSTFYFTLPAARDLSTESVSPAESTAFPMSDGADVNQSGSVTWATQGDIAEPRLHAHIES